MMITERVSAVVPSCLREGSFCGEGWHENKGVQTGAKLF